MQRRAGVIALLASVACAPASSSRPPIHDPNAALVVALGHSEEVPTAIRMEVSNPGASPVSFCRPQTAFEGLSGNIFEIRGPDGAELPYQGPMVKRAPPGPDDCFPVQPGRFHTAEVDLLDGYALQAGTTYSVRYRASAVSTLPSSPWFDFTVD